MALLFRGVHTLNLDAKGRMAMPTRYRERLHEHANGELVVTIDTEERCLVAYPRPEWEEIERKLDGLTAFNRQAVRVKRLLMGHAADVEMDGHGRLLLPPPLREFASLDKRLVFVGQGKKFELWDDAHWSERREQWLKEEMASFEDLPAELQSLSL